MQHYKSPLIPTDGQPAIVYIDIKSPYAFVALKPIFALERELDLQFDWRPLTLDIPSYLGSAKKKAGKVVESNRSASQWSGVKYAYRDARRYIERQGYILKGTEKIWDSSIANIGILWVIEHARDKLEAYLEAVYAPFWRRELDIEDVTVVAASITAAGVCADGFEAFQAGIGKQIHDQLQGQLHSNNIYGVPTYVIDGQILFGREHLPLVRWHLTGKQGDAPDIAYELNDAPSLELNAELGAKVTAQKNDIKLTLFIDFKSPAAYLALKPTLDFIKTHHLDVKWLPFPTKQSAIAAEQDNETKGETHRRVRAFQRQQMHEMYAELSDTQMHFRSKPGNSDLALNVLANLSVDPTSFISRAYDAYWIEGKDLNDAAVVEQLVTDAGLRFSIDLLHSKAIDNCIEQAQAQGVFEVPTFVIQQQLFIGREHMPWLKEIVSEKKKCL
ncbi:MAG: hypothetical protein HOF32_21025 [Gammaproteobacteria bacterium]|jgi:2-hydroxychromene-2-carboxylate isomerase|nr:hypothetical protein [Gammaproteobacteria bacterium]MBT3901183.1 hypothetical protein [Gammaproteobacteria bacterium]